MQPIVLATDFSPSATEAAKTAARLAQLGQTELILAHAYRFWPTNPAETGDFPLSSQAMKEASQQALQSLAGLLHQEVGDGLPIHCITREGYTHGVLNEIVSEKNADLLVMSTVGTAPQSVRFMGSVATEMITETHVPLLLLPPETALTQVRSALLAIDLDTPPDAIKLEIALDFGRRFGATLHAVCITDEAGEPATAHRIEQLRGLLSRYGHTLTTLPGTDITGMLFYEALLNKAQTRQADLIMMFPQPHSWFRQLFTEGETQRIARLTPIPLLAIV